MPTTLETAVAQYLRSGNPAQRTREEYSTTLRKWERWGGGLPLDQLGRKEFREFLDWVYEDAAAKEGRNPGRTANKVRSHLRAVMSWAWEQDLVDSLPRFPKHKPQRDVAGRHYLTKAEINSLYFATHDMKCPRGWSRPLPVGRYWRCAIVVFFNYGVDYADFQIMQSTSIAMSEGLCYRVFSLPWTCPCALHYPVLSSQRDLRNRSSSSSGWKRKLPPDGGCSVSSAFSFNSKLLVT